MNGAIRNAIWLILLTAVLPALVAAQENDDKARQQADVPVKRVVMFNSGVAYFERAGKVEGDATLEMRFRVQDINDLLKSMVLRDLGGGRISTVSYESQKPVEKTLETFAIDLTENPSLAALLDQVRGEKIEIHAPTKLTGTIIGVEYRETPVGDDETIKVPHLNLLTDEGLRSVSLENVGRIKLTNEKLDAELRQALAVLAANKSSEKKTVTLHFLGEKEREVQVGYIQESPIWKTSYRLVLAGEKPPHLQGWAIVENTTEDDWEGVQLSLVSGRPISFLMDLYQPLFVERPVVEPELYSSLRPRTYEQDLAGERDEFRRKAKADDNAAMGDRFYAETQAKSGRMRAGALGGMGAGGRGFGGGELLKREEQLGAQVFNPAAGVESVAQAADVGQMFQYTIATPVKLPRQQSAMLPIVNDSVQAEKLSIYNEQVHAKHPLHGLRLKNTTDLHLMQGPVTVFDEGVYAGDSRIMDLPPGSERLMSYAMDLETEVAPSHEAGPTQLVSVKLAKGTLVITHRHERKRSYVVKNSGDEARKVLVEYPIDDNWELSEPKEPAEKTRDVYRFALTAEPGKPATLNVVEKRTERQDVLVTNLNNEAILFYVNAREVSDDVKKALREILRRKQTLAKVTSELNELNRRIEVIFGEQERMRENMKEVPRDSELFRRYLTKLGEQESDVESLRDEVSKKIAERDEAQKALDDYLLSLDVE